MSVPRAKLAGMPVFITERCVFETRVLAAALLGVVLSVPVLAQAPGHGNVPRADYFATMDTEFRKIDSDKDGIVLVAEMKAAGVIK